MEKKLIENSPSSILFLLSKFFLIKIEKKIPFLDCSKVKKTTGDT